MWEDDGGEVSAFLALSLDDLSEKIKMEENYTPVSRMVLYQDILCGLLDKNILTYELEQEYNMMYKL